MGEKETDSQIQAKKSMQNSKTFIGMDFYGLVVRRMRVWKFVVVIVIAWDPDILSNNDNKKNELKMV